MRLAGKMQAIGRKSSESLELWPGLESGPALLPYHQNVTKPWHQLLMLCLSRHDGLVFPEIKRQEKNRSSFKLCLSGILS